MLAVQKRREQTVTAPLVDATIERIRQLIASGEWGPGDRLPPEAELSVRIGGLRKSAAGGADPLEAAAGSRSGLWWPHGCSTGAGVMAPSSRACRPNCSWRAS